MGTPSAEYMREYRANNAAYTAKTNMQHKAKLRAQRLLATLHQREYQELYDKALKQLESEKLSNSKDSTNANAQAEQSNYDES